MRTFALRCGVPAVLSMLLLSAGCGSESSESSGSRMEEEEEEDAAPADAARLDAADADLDAQATEDATVQPDADANDVDSDIDASDVDSGDASTSDAAVGPTLVLNGAAEIALDCNATFDDPGASASDAQGAVAVEVTAGIPVDTSAPGTRTIRYRATSNGVSTELSRTIQVCGPACGDLGKVPLDLTNWTAIQYEQNYQPDANWVLAQNKLSVTQTVNADASIFLSDFDAQDFAIEGRWRMASSSDDDFVGFVFGYRDRGHYYLFDWKQGTQTFFGGVAQVGMTLKVVNATTPDAGAGALQLSSADLWYSAGTSNVSTLQKDGVPFHNSVPWQENQDYFFFLEFHAGSFRIEVRDAVDTTLVSWIVQDGTFTSGGFGFYNFSQGPVTYQTFTRRATPPACSTAK